MVRGAIAAWECLKESFGVARVRGGVEWGKLGVSAE